MKNEGLKITDRIEGYHPDRDRCLYVREEVVVQFKDGTKLVAWTYFYADLVAAVGCPRLAIGEVEGMPVFAWRNRK